MPAGTQAGNMCIRNPWPGIMQTIWGDPDRFVEPTTQVQQIPERARTGATGRTCRRRRDGPDGYFRILGRVDDVINVAGHRLGPKRSKTACLRSRRWPKPPWSGGR